MDLRSALGYLLDNEYLVLIENQLIITKKLTDSLNLPDRRREVVEDSAVTVAPPVTATKVTKKVSKDLKQVWDQFIIDAEIPWRVTTPSGEKYTVRQYGPSAAQKLLQIINTEGVDYDTLTASTKYYYKNTTYKAILSNYLLKDLWKEEYNEFKKGHSSEGEQGNRFED